MRWTEQVIAAHKNSLAQRPADRRPRLIAHWEQYRSDGHWKPAVEMSLELAAQGNANEVELGFYVLMDLAVSDAALRCHVSQLAKHKSATVRRNLAFYMSKELPPDFSMSVFAELLGDKAASVRIRAIETVGMRDWKAMLPVLRTLRSREQTDKVIQTLSYWIPLLEAGYRVDRSQEPGRFEVTALTGRGTASRTVEASGPDDPRIRAAVDELRKFP
jgi:hypothetical protein